MAASDYDALPQVAANHQPLTPLLFLERSGYVEETYHTFSYSPLRDDDGGRVVGMLCVFAVVF